MRVGIDNNPLIMYPYVSDGLRIAAAICELPRNDRVMISRFASPAGRSYFEGRRVGVDNIII